MGTGQTQRFDQLLTGHTTITASLAAFDAALDSTLVTSEEMWRSLLQSEFAVFLKTLQVHCVLAEGDGGIFGEIEVVIGHGKELTTARDLHRTALRQSEELNQLLQRANILFDVAAVRAISEDLDEAVRQHHVLEADLLQHVMIQETGTSD